MSPLVSSALHRSEERHGSMPVPIREEKGWQATAVSQQAVVRKRSPCFVLFVCFCRRAVLCSFLCCCIVAALEHTYLKRLLC